MLKLVCFFYFKVVAVWNIYCKRMQKHEQVIAFVLFNCGGRRLSHANHTLQSVNIARQHQHVEQLYTYNYMVSGSQNAACFSNRGEFILRVFSQGFVPGSFFLTLLNPATNHVFFLNFFVSDSKSVFFLLEGRWRSEKRSIRSGFEGTWRSEERSIKSVLEGTWKVKSLASRAYWKVR